MFSGRGTGNKMIASECTLTTTKRFLRGFDKMCVSEKVDYKFSVKGNKSQAIEKFGWLGTSPVMVSGEINHTFLKLLTTTRNLLSTRRYDVQNGRQHLCTDDRLIERYMTRAIFKRGVALLSVLHVCSYLRGRATLSQTGVGSLREAVATIQQLQELCISFIWWIL